jgi:hypothetical protein
LTNSGPPFLHRQLDVPAKPILHLAWRWRWCRLGLSVIGWDEFIPTDPDDAGRRLLFLDEVPIGINSERSQARPTPGGGSGDQRSGLTFAPRSSVAALNCAPEMLAELAKMGLRGRSERGVVQGCTGSCSSSWRRSWRLR